MKGRTLEVRAGDYLEAQWGGFTRGTVFLSGQSTLIRAVKVGEMDGDDGKKFVGIEVKTVVGEKYPYSEYYLGGAYDDGGVVVMHELTYLKNLKVGLKLRKVPQAEALEIENRVKIRGNGRVNF